MAWEENPRICLHMQLIAILSRTGVELSLLKLCHGEKECHVMEQLRGDIASSRPMLTKGCCKGNNYEQRFALDTFTADFYWRNVLAKPCILLFTLQQECNTREACRLLLL